MFLVAKRSPLGGPILHSPLLSLSPLVCAGFSSTFLGLIVPILALHLCLEAPDQLSYCGMENTGSGQSFLPRVYGDALSSSTMMALFLDSIQEDGIPNANLKAVVGEH